MSKKLRSLFQLYPNVDNKLMHLVKKTTSADTGNQQDPWRELFTLRNISFSFFRDSTAATRSKAH